ncbi:hypothetical protein [Thermodesulforhabdus norvegica]|uniref:Uncharacterized protein n=1 Tax=Thermodesulforhabdus norvegica TaxID=39841 RepID=A0A1I4QMI0_9BACT|nr:hypothetical protein [Thermodesulforhabdus norvegica]SFM40956.1 hypothetical protein SAMN05660836_00103 [Thermodesulforhabdus norvegica]
MKLMSVEDFRRENEPWKTYYVAFLKGSHGAWFPFCVMSSEKGDKLDTLCVSKSYSLLEEVVKPCVDKIEAIEQYIVHYVYGEEINNLIDRYGLSHVGYIEDDGECGCGCGCR